MKKYIVILFLALIGIGQSVLAYSEPYYAFIHKKNPKLTGVQIAEIVSANRTFSDKYKVSMYWHICKTSNETGFKTEIGTVFYINNKKYNSEPCYGIEALQVDVVKGMYPNLTEKQIIYKLLHDYRFAIECSYRLDYANQISATKMGLSTAYANRTAALIIYNSGIGSWRRFHEGLYKYLKHGGKIEDLTVRQWAEYRFNFREVYSLNYYSGVLRESFLLDRVFNEYRKAQVSRQATPTMVVK